jgi:hypothetical protein
MNLTKRSCLIVLTTLFVGAGTSLAQSRIQLAQGKRVIQDKVKFVIDIDHDKTGNPRYAEAPEDMRVWMRFSEHAVSGKVYVDGKAIGRFDETMTFNSNPINVSYGRHTITLAVSGPATLYDLYVDLRGGLAHEILDEPEMVAPPPVPDLSKRVADLEHKVHDLEAEIASLKKKRNH